ncbi:MAG: hypothetical protein KF764_12575 [Labilithrix sp.]|nr:hypothetical protein [Labilithrix sp.]
MRRRLGLLLASCLPAVAWLGCNAILGNESAVFAPEGVEASLDPDGDARIDGAPSDAPAVLPDGADPDPDAGPCVDVATNAKHCGSCFHDCLGGSCSGGVCQPFQLATDESGPFAIAVDATHVYWTNRTTGNLKRVPISGGNAQMVFDGPPGTPLGDELAVHGGMVYFAHTVGDAGVVRCPVGGCPNGGPIPVVETDGEVSFVKIENGVLLFIVPAEGQVGRCPLPCNGAPEIVASGEPLPLRASQSGSVIAWSVITNNLRIKNGAATPLSVPTGAGYATGITVSGGSVYAQEHNLGPLVAPTDGGPVRRLSSSTFSFSEEIALDDTSVYFTDTTPGGRVMRCPRSGCGDSGAALATGQQQPRGIAVDAKSVYWVTEGTSGVGMIMRVAK